MGTITIPLTQGKVAIIDEEDYLLISQYKWHASRGGWGGVCAISGKEGIRMHRLIMNAPSSLMVDHVNGDALDNRRANLRLANAVQNQRNKRLGKNNKSGYKGVFWDAGRKRWRASITYHGANIRLGRFRSVVDAAMVYDIKARELYGAYGRYNFPKEGEQGVR